MYTCGCDRWISSSNKWNTHVSCRRLYEWHNPSIYLLVTHPDWCVLARHIYLGRITLDWPKRARDYLATVGICNFRWGMNVAPFCTKSGWFAAISLVHFWLISSVIFFYICKLNLLSTNSYSNEFNFILISKTTVSSRFKAKIKANIYQSTDRAEHPKRNHHEPPVTFPFD